MKDIIITIKNKTRKVAINTDILGVVGENLQGNFIVDFTDEFIDGICVLECELPDGTCGCIPMEQEAGKMYIVPVKSSLLTTAGTVALQIRITGNGVNNEVQIFKSDIFKLGVEESINASVEVPETYPEWLDLANAKLSEIDQAIEKTEQLSADFETAIQESQSAIERANTISEDLEEKVATDYYRGEKGDKGADAIVDDALSETSENAIQNKIATQELNAKAKIDASNLTEENIESWKTALGIGQSSGVIIRRWN